MKRFFSIIAVALALTGCSIISKIDDAKTKVDDFISDSQNEINMACWSLRAADSAFQYLYAPQASVSVKEYEATAMLAVGEFCNTPPTNATEALLKLRAALLKITSSTLLAS